MIYASNCGTMHTITCQCDSDTNNSTIHVSTCHWDSYKLPQLTCQTTLQWTHHTSQSYNRNSHLTSADSWSRSLTTAWYVLSCDECSFSRSRRALSNSSLSLRHIYTASQLSNHTRLHPTPPHPTPPHPTPPYSTPLLAIKMWAVMSD